MLTKKVSDALNKQINHEFHSSFHYLAMTAYFGSLNLNGFALYMRAQAQDEMNHGMQLYDYVTQRGGRVVLTKMDAPPATWKSPLAAIEDAYRHECKTSEMINALVSLALKDNDHATSQSLHALVLEQVRDEATANEVLEQLKLVGDDSRGLFLMDRELRGQSAGKP